MVAFATITIGLLTCPEYPAQITYMEAFNFTTNDFTFTDGILVSNQKHSVFPEIIRVKSTHTDRIVEFHQDNIAAMNNEFWDGELMEYISRENTKVKKVVLTHSGPFHS